MTWIRLRELKESVVQALHTRRPPEKGGTQKS